ncbi:glycosyl transferase family 1 [Yoonia sediminilitoris]|uniref:Glycosyl transferase family 1 n=2 Tax=Yoonia sediminilitoris TaxID=1286148 RepID=A0A2T6KRQ0_9RHOB|nr:glycosyl transferase family 1 [Yoonia sediminilitoris]RCW99404.1 glycosyl transferase family 1 [Yoonia sediminilitoris]
MVLSEAMLNGLPIISCGAGAVADTVQDAGLLVAPDDANAFAAGLRQLLTNAQDRQVLRAKARNLSQSLPTWSDTARCVTRVIKQHAETHLTANNQSKFSQ